MAPLKITWHFYWFISLLLFSTTAFSQMNITGRVVDEIGDTPIANASVYFNNTTIGTNTNSQGAFTLDSVTLLNTEMVVACKGYEVLVFKPTAAQIAGKRIVVKIAAKTKPKKSEIAFTEPAARRQALEIFFQSFLGFTQEATQCAIQNTQAIYFMQGNNKSVFAAYADTTIVIINNMLGYKMNLDIAAFFYDQLTGANYLTGYVRYEPLGNSKTYAKYRRDCYYGSSMHFYRSLIANQLYQQGYATFLIPPVKDSSKMSLFNDPEAAAENEKMRAVPIPANQILYIDSANNFSIRAEGKLLVQYMKNPAGKKFLTLHENTSGSLKKGVESFLHFKTPNIGLNNAGVLSDPTSVTYDGYWMYERAANTLPFNYQPD